MKSYYIIPLLVALLASCGSNEKQELKLESIADYKNFLIINDWGDENTTIKFLSNSTCKFQQVHPRTGEYIYNLIGTFKVDKAKFNDSGEEFFFVQCDWKNANVAPYAPYDIFVLYDFLGWQFWGIEVGRYKFDEYGLVLNYKSLNTLRGGKTYHIQKAK